ncbi:polyprenyl synthetase family protein [Nocardia brasiliensis]|uniref:polyprenyl synthetase family protein n=1 Tax=Nocardia brasiliensis TaxID=37326 RepID=UPI003797908C
MAIGPAQRRVPQILDEVRVLVGPAHRAIIDGLSPALARVARYHIGWTDTDGNPIQHAGKAIRPALAVLSARAVGGDAVAAVPVAVAVELIHDFTLLHDDIMDDDRTRRGRPAAWTVFGTATAVLTGDALLALTWDLAASESISPAAMAVLGRTLLELCRGQSADLTFERCTDISLAEALDMAEHKTGALLGAACELGALAGGAESVAALAYRQFGRQLGIVFQLVDDLLGIWGDPLHTGKHVGADLVAQKNSLPIVAAMASGTTAGDRLAELYRDTESMNPRVLQQATELVELAGGREWVQTEIDRRMRLALDSLDAAEPVPAISAELHALAQYLTRRDG